jgi:hypothetical protein
MQTKIRRDIKSYFILIKGTIYQDHITNVNINAQIIAPSFIKETQMHKKEQKYCKKIRLYKFNTPITTKDRLCRKKINTKPENNTISQKYFIDIYRIFHKLATWYTFINLYPKSTVF